MNKKVIEFPSIERQRVQQIEKAAHALLARIKPEFAACAKDRLQTILARYNGPPPFRMEIECPQALSEEMASHLMDGFQQAIRSYRQTVAYEMELLLLELCHLEVRLCSLEAK